MPRHGTWNGEGRVYGNREPDEIVGHRCGLCFGPYGKSAIPCKRDPAVIAAARSNTPTESGEQTV